MVLKQSNGVLDFNSKGRMIGAFEGVFVWIIELLEVRTQGRDSYSKVAHTKGVNFVRREEGNL